MTDGKPRSALRSAAANLGWLLANRGLMAVLSLAYLAITARSLGVADFGRFALVTGASRALATLVSFQTWQIIVNYGVEPMQAGEDARLGRLFRLGALLDLGSALAGMVIAAAILLIWAGDFGITHDLMRGTMFFLIIQLVTIRSMPVGVLRLRDRFASAALADSVTPVVRLAGSALVLLARPSVSAFLLAWAAAEVVTAAVYWAMLIRSGDLSLAWHARFGGGDVRAENPGITRFAISSSASSTLGLSTKQLPLLLVGGFVGPAAAGLFRMAFQISSSLTKLSQLITRAAFPEIVRTLRQAGEKVARALGRMFLASAAVAAVIMAGVVLVGKPLLVLMGGAPYAAAYGVLLWLSLAACLEFSAVTFEPVLMASNRATIALGARMVAVAALIGAMFAFMPTHGATGAAMGVLVGSGTTVLLMGAAILRVGKAARAKPVAIAPDPR